MSESFRRLNRYKVPSRMPLFPCVCVCDHTRRIILGSCGSVLIRKVLGHIAGSSAQVISTSMDHKYFLCFFSTSGHEVKSKSALVSPKHQMPLVNEPYRNATRVVNGVSSRCQPMADTSSMPPVFINREAERRSSPNTSAPNPYTIAERSEEGKSLDRRLPDREGDGLGRLRAEAAGSAEGNASASSASCRMLPRIIISTSG